MSPGFPPSRSARGPMPGDVEAIGGPPKPPRPAEQPSASPVTLEMLNYHGEEERCDGCSHFRDPDQCEIDPGTKVSPGGHCQAYSGGGGQPSDEPDQAAVEEDMEYQ